MASIETDNSIFHYLVTLLVVISPIIAPYNSGISFIILPELLFILLLPLMIIQFEKKPVLNYLHIVILFYFSIICLSISSYFFQDSFSLNEYLKATLRIGFYFLLIILISRNFFDFEFGMKIYETLAVCGAVYLIIQKIVYELFSYIMPWYITWLPMHSETYLQANFEALFGNFYRPSSFFIEPAHFAQYVLPVLLYLLIYNKKIKFRSLLKALIITVAIAYSTSGTGILLTIIIWCYWSLKNVSFKLNNVIMLIVCIAFLSYTLYGNSSSIEKSLNRLSFENPLSSSNIRIVRGFTVYSEIPLINKLFGIGYGNYGNYVLSNDVVTEFDLTGNKVWVNAAAYNLMGTGILGFAALLFMICSFIKNTEGFFKLRAIMLLISLFYSDEFTTVSIILTFSILFEGAHRCKQKKFKGWFKNENIICD